MTEDLFRKAICCAPLSERARIVLAVLTQHPLLGKSAATVNTIAWEAQFSLTNTARILRQTRKHGKGDPMKNPTLKFLFEKLDETITEAEKDANPYLMASALAQTNAIGDVIACFRDRWEEYKFTKEELEYEPEDEELEEDEVPVKDPVKDPDEEEPEEAENPAEVIEALMEMGMKQREIAKRIGISQSHVSYLRKTTNKNSIPVRRALSNLLAIEKAKRGG